ncbi:hypothetical protein, partial [Halobiforma nitratireducens]
MNFDGALEPAEYFVGITDDEDNLVGVSDLLTGDESDIEIDVDAIEETGDYTATLHGVDDEGEEVEPGEPILFATDSGLETVSETAEITVEDSPDGTVTFGETPVDGDEDVTADVTELENTEDGFLVVENQAGDNIVEGEESAEVTETGTETISIDEAATAGEDLTVTLYASDTLDNESELDSATEEVVGEPDATITNVEEINANDEEVTATAEFSGEVSDGEVYVTVEEDDTA